MLFAVIWGTLFMRWQYMICPVKDLGVNAWSDIKCDPNPVFIWREWEIPVPLRVFLSSLVCPPLTPISISITELRALQLGRNTTTLPYTTYHFHVLVMAIFASLVAPFGGFFASGFKRAFNIKDFGHSIPGHGGMTDRMDCQYV
jgi:phosphatidate cytidylyltransferase